MEGEKSIAKYILDFHIYALMHDVKGTRNELWQKEQFNLKLQKCMALMCCVGNGVFPFRFSHGGKSGKSYRTLFLDDIFLCAVFRDGKIPFQITYFINNSYVSALAAVIQFYSLHYGTQSIKKHVFFVFIFIESVVETFFHISADVSQCF